MFTCYSPVWTPRAQGSKGYLDADISLNLSYFMLSDTLLLFYHRCFPSSTSQRTNVLGDSEKERRVIESVFVRKQRISFALLKVLWRIYYKDQYSDLDGSGTQTLTSSESFKKRNVSVCGGKNPENLSPLQATNHSYVLLRKLAKTLILWGLLHF